MRTVYIVTHGEKELGPDPAMTTLGFTQVAALRDKLPNPPSIILCGTGQRQQDVAHALGFVPDRYSAAVGGPESLEVKGDGTKVIVMANGLEIDCKDDTTEADGAPAMLALTLRLPDNAVITTGRVALIMLGLTLAEAKSAAVYTVTHDGEKIQSIQRI